MLSLDAIAVISTVAALTAVAGAVWGARAAHRSALTAHEAARHAERVDRRGLLRDLISTCHRLIAESVEIGSLIEELKTEYRLLAAISGQTGSAREKLHLQRAESKHKEIRGLQDEAHRRIQDRAQLLGASEEEFVQMLTQLDGYLVRTLRIKSSLQREISSVAGSNRLYREDRVRGANQRLQKSER